ncbi:unnamed protein product (macronuclear) [Paramecium tetraurelia]|uniref:Uncharacterized protein n=1 Tax=Paramecium tetraurelia TaxID=5888 RepID=A0DXF3_PARTE|nr:uncharacterized protein GSPATT00021353001 [Paramecium tetraurelia]CAK87720.1 unnamed protein product [Paramecium tetraurelia]|eukprot:XP_001455117.1 hypothetical protein (macronuclear) [Paramecium tetraurelia strain d4-2]
MQKDSSRDTFEKKFQYVTKKRVLAYKKLIKSQNILNIKGGTEFLEGINNKPYMSEDDQKEFNQKFSQQYNHIQTLYKKCLKSRMTSKYNKQKREKVSFIMNKDLVYDF